MEQINFIDVKELCAHYGIHIQFITALKESGLIELVEEKENLFLDENQLENFDKLWRLHYELEINVAGMETIQHLLQQMHILQHQLTIAKTKLQFYENVVFNE